MKRRILSIIMAVAMTLSLMAVPAFAAGDDETGGNAATTEGITSEGALKTAIADASEGGTVTLGDDITVTEPIVINKEIKLDLNGKKISNSSAIWNEDGGKWSLISVGADGDLTITGAGKLQALKDDCYAVDVVDGGSCTIENGTFVGNIHAVYVLQGTLVVNGGTFSVQQKYSEQYPYEYVLNCFDANYKAGTASITVNGGSFADFNPRNCRAEGAGTNFCAPGCVVEETTKDDNTSYYTVKKLDDGQMAVIPEQSADGSVSASLEGTYTSSTDKVENAGAVVNGNVSVDLPTTGETATAASLNVAADTAKSMANNGATLEVKSDVGTLTVSNAALRTISTNAKGAAVTLSIEKAKSDTNSATYELTAQTANGTDVFTESTGAITVSVPKPSNASAFHVYYLGTNGAEEITGVTVEENNVVWEVNHFSTYYITATEQTVSVTVDGQTTTAADLNTAMAAVGANDTATVTLMDDVTLSDGVDIAGTVTLDLNGYTITDGDAWSNNDDYLVAVKRGGNLTIEDSSANRTGAITSNNKNIYCAVKMTIKDEGESGKAATLTVNGGTMQGYYYGISGNGARHNTKITINGGTIKTAYENGTGIYHPQDGSLTVNGGSITGNTGIEIRSGSLTVTGGTITGGNEKPAVVTNGNGTTTSNTGIAIAQHTTEKPITVNITGGTITGSAAVYESNPQENQGTAAVSVTIKDATLTGDLKSAGFGDVSADNVTVNGNVDKTGTGNMGITDSTITGTAPTNDNNTTIVNTTVSGQTVNQVPEGAVAMVNGRTYAAWDGAYSAITANSTVTLLDNVETGTAISLPAGVTLNGNDHKITYTGERTDRSKPNNGAFITANKDADNVTIKNVTIDAGENIKHGVQFYCNDKGALSGVTINGAAWTSVMVNGATNVTIENCDLNPNSATGYANIEYGLGENVTEIPSVTVNNVTVDSSKPAIWVDDTTVTAIKSAMGGSPTNDQVRDKVTASIKNQGSNNIGVTFEWTVGNTDTTTVPGTNQSHGGSSGSSGYAITVPSNIKNGDVTVSPSRATAGTVVTITVKPDSGYELDSLTVTDKNGKTVALKDIGSNKYTFTMPSGAVKIAAEFVEEAPVSTLPFTDVAADAWYYDAVEYVYDNDLMNGTASTVFAPNATLTRGMLATVLWRMEGSPVVNYALPFEDVSGGQWYTEAIRWAASVGVVNGTSATTYAPNANITREQLATMLYRYAAYKSGSVSTSASLSGFTDAGSVSDYAADAMEWAVAEEIIGGMTSTTLVPQGSATRAQTATMLMRYCENVL